MAQNRKPDDFSSRRNAFNRNNQEQISVPIVESISPKLAGKERRKYDPFAVKRHKEEIEQSEKTNPTVNEILEEVRENNKPKTIISEAEEVEISEKSINLPIPENPEKPKTTEVEAKVPEPAVEEIKTEEATTEEPEKIPETEEIKTKEPEKLPEPVVEEIKTEETQTEEPGELPETTLEEDTEEIPEEIIEAEEAVEPENLPEPVLEEVKAEEDEEESEIKQLEDEEKSEQTENSGLVYSTYEDEEDEEPEYINLNDISEQDEAEEHTYFEEVDPEPIPKRRTILSEIDIDNMDVPIFEETPRKKHFSVNIKNNDEPAEDPEIEEIFSETEKELSEPSDVTEETIEEIPPEPPAENDISEEKPAVQSEVEQEQEDNEQQEDSEELRKLEEYNKQLVFEGTFELPDIPEPVEDDAENVFKPLDYDIDEEDENTESAEDTDTFQKIVTQENKTIDIDPQPELDNGKKTEKDNNQESSQVKKVLKNIDTAKKEIAEKRKSKRTENSKIEVKATPDTDFLEIEDKEKNSETKKRKKGFDDFTDKKQSAQLFNDLLDLRGKIVFRVTLLGILSVICCYIALANNCNLKMPEMINATIAPKSHILIQLIISVLSLFSSFGCIFSGIRKFFKGRSDSDTFSAFSWFSAFVAGIFMFFAPSQISSNMFHVYIPVAVISLLFNAVGKLITVDRAINNFEFVSSDVAEHYAILYVENEELARRITRGTYVDYPILAKIRKTDFLTDFLKYTYSADIADKYSQKAVPIITAVSALVAVFSALLFRNIFMPYAVHAGFEIFALCMSLCSCIAITMTVNVPLLKASEKYSERSAVLLGYQSVDDFYDINSCMADADQLFPKGTVRLHAIKTFSDTKIDDAIIDAASLTSHANSILRHIFMDILSGNRELLRPVENYAYENSAGLCGWIDNKRILLGNRELMTSHSIEGIPTKSKEKEYTAGNREAVYLSVSGNLSAMFIIDIRPSFAVKQALHNLENNNICLMLRSVDSLITISKLAEIFGVPEEMLKIIPEKMHREFEEQVSPVSKQSASMACENDFPTMSDLLISAKRIRKTAVAGLVLQSASAILGIVLAIVFIMLKSFDQTTASSVLIYNLLWAIISLIIAYGRKI